MISVIRPPKIVKTDHVIFLAGPIQGAPDWHLEAVEHLRELYMSEINLKDFHIACPKRLAVSDEEFNYDEQIAWETHYLNAAAQTGGIMFWLAKEEEQIPGRAYGQTSRFELGEWKARVQILNKLKKLFDEKTTIKMVVGIQQGFSGRRYLIKRLSEDVPEVMLCETLEETCKALYQIL